MGRGGEGGKGRKFFLALLVEIVNFDCLVAKTFYYENP
jgi:hypothetical protein